MRSLRLCRWFGIFVFALLGSALFGSDLAQAQEWKFTKLADYPNALGVASPFAGQSGACLLVAGGANFPDKKPWEGGKKVWHDEVYALDEPHGQWRQVGRLPRPLAYGISANWKDGIICVGGNDADQHVKDVFTLRYRDSELIIESLIDLPVPLANACGAIVEGFLIVTGGIDQPTALECQKRTWALDLRAIGANDLELHWRELDQFPGDPRMLATAAGFRNALWVIGGVALHAGADDKPVRKYLADCWKFELDPVSLSGHWVRQADLPSGLAASPGPAMVDGKRLWILGGDDGLQIGALPSEHRGFSKKILGFDFEANRWTESSQELPFSRVTVPMTPWRGGWLIPSGEAKPGIRSSEVWWVNKP
ncbi:MAG: hypothetical protein ACKOAU_10035 [Pirellula sp.]